LGKHSIQNKPQQIDFVSNMDALAIKLSMTGEGKDLLDQALTHPTFFEGEKNNLDNQRLEFLGDAILDFVVGEYLYKRYPEQREGDLTKMRAVVVCESALFHAALKMGIGKAMRLGKGSDAAGDRERSSVLADAFEAVLGAVYLHRGMDAARSIVLEQFADELDNLVAEGYEDSKSQLQEMVQKQCPLSINYRVLDSTGPDHAKIFESGVYCRDLILGKGSGNSKKCSQQEAAKDAIQNMDQWLPVLLDKSHKKIVNKKNTHNG